MSQLPATKRPRIALAPVQIPSRPNSALLTNTLGSALSDSRPLSSVSFGTRSHSTLLSPQESQEQQVPRIRFQLEPRALETADDNSNAVATLSAGADNGTQPIRLAPSRSVFGSGSFASVLGLVHHPDLIMKLSTVSQNLNPSTYGMGSSVVAEINSYAQLDSPYVTPLRAVALVDDDRRVGLVMPRALSGDLFEWQKRPEVREWIQGENGLRVVLFLLKQLLRGLDAIHTCGLVHRDVKGENVLVTDPAGSAFGAPQAQPWRAVRLQWTDFGLARPTQGVQSIPLQRFPDGSQAASNAEGTPLFMPIETYVGPTTGQAQDMWALGGLVLNLVSASDQIGYMIWSELRSVAQYRQMLQRCEERPSQTACVFNQWMPLFEDMRTRKPTAEPITVALRLVRVLRRVGLQWPQEDIQTLASLLSRLLVWQPGGRATASDLLHEEVLAATPDAVLPAHRISPASATKTGSNSVDDNGNATMPLASPTPRSSPSSALDGRATPSIDWVDWVTQQMGPTLLQRRRVALRTLLRICVVLGDHMSIFAFVASANLVDLILPQLLQASGPPSDHQLAGYVWACVRLVCKCLGPESRITRMEERRQGTPQRPLLVSYTTMFGLERESAVRGKLDLPDNELWQSARRELEVMNWCNGRMVQCFGWRRCGDIEDLRLLAVLTSTYGLALVHLAGAPVPLAFEARLLQQWAVDRAADLGPAPPPDDPGMQASCNQLAAVDFLRIHTTLLTQHRTAASSDAVSSATGDGAVAVKPAAATAPRVSRPEPRLHPHLEEMHWQQQQQQQQQHQHQQPPPLLAASPPAHALQARALRDASDGNSLTHQQLQHQHQNHSLFQLETWSPHMSAAMVPSSSPTPESREYLAFLSDSWR
jgi:serine/threonine protein kinase